MLTMHCRTSHRTSPGRFPWLWAIPPVAIVAATAIVGILRYPHLPDRLPVHFGLNGRPDAFAPRSIATAFTAVFLQAGITALVLGLAWAWLRMRPDLDPQRAAAGAALHRSRVGRLSRAALVLVTFMDAAFAMVAWAQWQDAGQAQRPLLAVVLLLVAGVAAFVAMTYGAVRDERQAAAAGGGVGLALNLGNVRSWLVVVAALAVAIAAVAVARGR